VFDLDAYLERVGLSGRPGLAELHRAHVTSIPFENLDPLRGVPVSLEPDALERKLVRARRGGYCYEQNLLLAAALRALHFDVELLLARVRLGMPAGTLRPRTHLVLRVRDGDAVWHADVGFGGGTLLEPIPFGPGEVHTQSGWSFRVVEDGRELVLQTHDDGEWKDVYALVRDPVPLVDVETSNWFSSTHPSSKFTGKLVVTANRDDGSRVSLTGRDRLVLIERSPSETRVTPVSLEEVPRLLGAVFGLPGFVVDAAGNVVPGEAALAPGA